MEFDKSRVYTAVNADELKIGSKCIFADTICILREQVQRKNYEDCIFLLRRIRGDDSTYRFDDGERWFSFVYLIEPPAEPKYKPFESVDKAMEAIKKHGGWIKDTIYNRCSAVIAYDDDMVKTVYDSVGVDALFDGFVFFDDGSPCGELVKE